MATTERMAALPPLLSLALAEGSIASTMAVATSVLCMSQVPSCTLNCTLNCPSLGPTQDLEKGNATFQPKEVRGGELCTSVV